jgi:8-oxo-dGTP diphosphatase
MDFLSRAGYRLAYRLLQVWWFVRWPEGHGAAVAVWQGDRLLMVRTSYRPELDFPGGAIDRGEAPLAAAVRELREETGLRAETAELAAAGEFRFVDNRRRITAHLFEWRPDGPVEPTADRREIVWTGFVAVDRLAGERLTPLPRLYLERRAAQPPPPSGTRQISRA